MTLSLVLSIIGPLIPIIGLFVTAYLAWKRELNKIRKDKIAAAYTAYIDAVARASTARTAVATQKNILLQLAAAGVVKLDQELTLTDAELLLVEESSARFINAHSTLVIYAPKEVIGALSHFYDHGGELNTEEGKKAFIALIKAMRDESEADSYDDFGAHVDNILVSGQANRAFALAEKLVVTPAEEKEPGKE
jgi:hypothetical protein